MQQFYAERQPPPEIHAADAACRGRGSARGWLAVEAGRPQGADRRAAARRQARPARPRRRATRRWPIRRASTQTATAQLRGARDAAGGAARCPALPRRIECFDISTIQGSETVASMVVCEDGRMKRGDYRKFRIGRGASDGRRFLDDFAAMRRSCGAATAKVLENGGPFPDLILIDGGKGQLDAAYAALEELGLSNLVAVGLAKREELVFTRDSDEPHRARPRQRRAAAAAAHPRRGAPLRRHLPPPGAPDARPAVASSTASPASGPRRRQDAAHHVRQRGRCPPRDPRGADGGRRRPKAADAVISPIFAHARTGP